MTFTYNSDQSTLLSRVRFQIGDTVSGNGPRPGNTNFSDEEIAAVQVQQVDEDKVIANLFGVLVVEWSKYAVSYTIGPRKEELWRIVDEFRKSRDRWSVVARTANTPFSSGVVRAGSNDNSEHT